MRDFRTLNIWQDGIASVKQAYRLAESLPVAEKYGLRSQICRSAASIPLNIAEVCSPSSQIDFKRFSLDYLSVVFDPFSKEQKMINNLISKLKANS